MKKFNLNAEVTRLASYRTLYLIKLDIDKVVRETLAQFEGKKVTARAQTALKIALPGATVWYDKEDWFGRDRYKISVQLPEMSFSQRYELVWRADKGESFALSQLESTPDYVKWIAGIDKKIELLPQYVEKFNELVAAQDEFFAQLPKELQATFDK